MRPKVVVITGAASGIGFALAKSCALRQMIVIMLDNAAQALHEAANLIRQEFNTQIVTILCDVGKFSEVESAAKEIYERFDGVNWLFNNAGISGPLVPLWNLSIEQTRHVIDVNVFGVVNGIQVFLPLMFNQGFPGHVINMSSVYGLCSGSLVGAYSMSKHAIVALSESLFFDLQRLNKPIDVSVVCPSFVSTPLLNHSIQENPLHQKMQALFERGNTPEHVAEYILKEVMNKTFYILPDAEVKHYAEQRLKDINAHSSPTAHGLEKIMSWVTRQS